jgi:hypothetical protein
MVFHDAFSLEVAIPNLIATADTLFKAKVTGYGR